MKLITWLEKLSDRLSQSRSSRCTIRQSSSKLPLAAEVLEDRTLLSTFTVTSTKDVIDASDGALTLREAILAANTNPGADTIAFRIPAYDSSGVPVQEDSNSDGYRDVFVIRPLSPLPVLNDPTGGTTIDGFSQKFFTGDDNPPGLDIVLEGTLAGNSYGLRITSDNNAVFGLNIHSFQGSGIEIDGGDSNWIAANYIGTDPMGRFARGNGGSGVWIGGGGSGNVVGSNGDGLRAANIAGSNQFDLPTDEAERNLISGNAFQGVAIAEAGTERNVIAGNYIGTDRTGTSAIANSQYGIAIWGGGAGGNFNVIGTNGDGIADATERNVISGNGLGGMVITGQGHDNVIAGNYIGVDVSGSQALANIGSGILVFHGHHNIIGTDGNGVSDSLERNIISGNTFTGVSIANADSNFNTIAGNYIGTDRTGQFAIPNPHGILIENSASDNIIGTNGDGSGDAVEGNLISGNTGFGAWVRYSAARNTFAGNFVGTDVTRAQPLGNGADGVIVTGGANRNIIGTNGDGWGDQYEGNIISGNGAQGVYISDSGTDENVVAGNLIGLTVGGTAPLGNAFNGIAIISGAQNNRIGTNGDNVSDLAERNLISANGHVGVHLTGSSTANNVVAGNYIGTDLSGSLALPNGEHGVAIFSGATFNRIGTDGDGVADAAERNVISGNNWSGVAIAGAGADGNVVAGNLIGTDADGATALSNRRYGVVVQTSRNRIGTNADGTGDQAERNLISGNAWGGIRLNVAGGENLIAGNFIGTNHAGTSAIANSGSGIQVDGSTSDNRLLKNLISGNTGSGISIEGSDDNFIAGNFIGTDATGALALRNREYGVYITEGSQRNVVGTNGDGVEDDGERNVISGNRIHGIRIFGSGTDRNVIAGNYLGVAVDGATDLGNGSSGVAIVGGARLNVIGTNSDGINDTLERNIISGNDEWGIIIRGSHENTVAGNYIGTDAAGNISLGNGTNGVQIDGGSQNNLVGTNGDAIGDEAERNVISGNHSGGVVIEGIGTDSNIVAGNYLGVDAMGIAALGNQTNGLRISGGAQYNRVGTNGDGTGDGAERNIISANGYFGLQIAGVGTNENIVAGNYIGTNASGTAALGNNWAGVRIEAGAAGNRIGTDGKSLVPLAERNVISGTGNGNGVSITGSGTDRNTVAGNFIGLDATGTFALGNSSNGVRLDSGSQGNTIGTNGDGVNDAQERNIISGNGISGVLIQSAHFNIVAGNSIGTDVSGSIALGNGAHGVNIQSGARDNLVGTNGNGQADEVERNIISGNAQIGVGIFGAGTDGNRVAGNYVGVDFTGLTPLGNRGRGVVISGGAQFNRIGTNIVSLPNTAERNVISNNGGHGIMLSSASDFNVVSGNYIGIDAEGIRALGNNGAGVFLSGVSHTHIDGNVISGNSASGITLHQESRENAVVGNFIGTDATGHVAIGNSTDGLSILGGSQHNQVGTDGDGVVDEAERNVISGNPRYGIHIAGPGADHNVVAGNVIGADVTGTNPLPNTNGIRIQGGASNNRVGADESELVNDGVGNLIVFNQEAGVLVLDSSVGNTIRGNSTHSNGGLGIDLGGEGVTPNDAGDLDTGSNHLQNVPVLDPVQYNEGTLILTGHLDSLPGTEFVLDFYANDGADSSGYGEGQRWLGSLTVMANEVFAFPLGTNVTWDEWITATATAPDGSTSEFSNAVAVNAPPTAIIGGPSTVLEGGSIPLDASASSDPNQEASTLVYEWDFDYDGSTFAVEATGSTPTFDASHLDGPSIRTVAVRVTDTGGLTDIASVSIVIENVPPSAGIAGPEQAFAGESLAFVLSANDPSLADENAGFTFQIDWNGDSVIDQVVPPGDSLVVQHHFDQAGAFMVRVTATDKDGGTSEVASHEILIIQPVQIDVRDMVNLQNQGLLMVTVFSTSDFDATRIDISTVLFAGASAHDHLFEDADGDGILDLVLRFRPQDTNLRETYEQLLADDINTDGELDSNKQEAEVILAGQTLDEIFIEGGEQLNLFLAGKALRDLLEDMASRGVI